MLYPRAWELPCGLPEALHLALKISSLQAEVTIIKGRLEAFFQFQSKVPRYLPQ